MSTEEADLEDIFLQLTRGAHDSDHDTPPEGSAGRTKSGGDAAA
jgi:hypothetical protein